MTSAALHAALLASDSATAVLERLCAGPVHIRRLSPPDPAPCPSRLVPASEAVHRRVALLCGAIVLSEADLWFLPQALPVAMVRALAETAAPFGRVVQPLGLSRRHLSAHFGGPGEAVALEHRALLRLPEGLPVAEVWERYGRALVSES